MLLFPNNCDSGIPNFNYFIFLSFLTNQTECKEHNLSLKKRENSFLQSFSIKTNRLNDSSVSYIPIYQGHLKGGSGASLVKCLNLSGIVLCLLASSIPSKPLPLLFSSPFSAFAQNPNFLRRKTPKFFSANPKRLWVYWIWGLDS